MYKLSHSGAIANLEDQTWIPADPGNAEYQRYLAWLAAGNTPAPADPAPSTTPTQGEQFSALVDNLTPQLQSATTLDEVKTIFGQALSGLDRIYGNQG